MRFQHIIFDCDGVLIDSEAISMDIDVALLAESGVAISVEDAHRRFVGTTFEAMISEIEAEHGIALPADLSARKDARMMEAYRRSLQPVPGVAAALAKIKLPKSVGTNGPRARAIAALKLTGLWGHFDGMTTFEDVKDGKPAPDIYLLAAARASKAPADCVVVEDSETGVRAGVAAGCTVYGFVGTAHDKAAQGRRLMTLGAQRIITAMDELPGSLAE
jgi:HAD superfamily hydrolase (TIGR01509 family)